MLAALSLAGILQGFAINGLINVVISTLEKRFHLKSAQSGLIPSFYDIGAFFASFPIAYYGGMTACLRLYGCECVCVPNLPRNGIRASEIKSIVLLPEVDGPRKGKQYRGNYEIEMKWETLQG